MGLFSRKKKGNIKTPFGYINEFTTEKELPNDLPTLRAMAYYYTYRVKNREYSYYIDKKIISVDTKKEYMDSRFRMAMNYFDGFMVMKDNEEGSRYFIEWMDWQFLSNNSLGVILSALKNYFYYGFRSYSYLLEMAMRRIELDIKNNAEPVGMCIYKSIMPLWQYSKLVEILGIEQRNATVYFEFLRDNFNLPDAEFMLDLVCEEKNAGTHYTSDKYYLKCESYAKDGNILAIAYMIDTWLYVSKDTKDNVKIADNAKYKAEYERLLAEYKEMQLHYNHNENLAVKEQTDKMLLEYEEVFKGTFEKLPESYPFSVKEGSVLYHAQRLTKGYSALWQNALPNEKLKKEIVESGEFLLKKKCPYGMYKVLLCKANFPSIHNWKKTTGGIYNDLCEMQYAPALALSRKVTKENRALLLELMLNEELNREEAQRYFELALKAERENNYMSAICNLSRAKHFGKEIPEHIIRSIVRNSVIEANKVLKGDSSCLDLDQAAIIFRTAADDFHEPKACMRYAIILNNNRSVYKYALEYLRLAEKYSNYSYVDDGPVSEEFRKILAENIETAIQNIDQL